MGTCEFCGRMIDDCRTSPCRAIAGEAGHATAAIVKAIDRLTEAVKALAGRRDPEPDRCPAMLKSGNVSIRCVRRLGHGDDCE